MRAKVQTGEIDHEVADLAGRQHGVVGRRQLLALGLSAAAISRRVCGGRLHSLHAGVYAVGHKAVTRRGRWMAAVLFCGEGAVLSHRSAAALWGIRSWSGADIDVTSPRKSRSRGVIQRHRMLLPEDEITIEDGIPVTTVPRTIFDLAADPDFSPQQAESALRQSEYLRLHDSLSLPALLDRYPGRAGTRTVRAALARRGESAGHTRSALEDRFLALLDRHDLPRPQLNAWLEAGGNRYEVDCLWPPQRQIVELDGYQAHGTRTAFRQDRTRDRRLVSAGYRVTRLTWSQLTEEPTQIVRDLRPLLATVRAPELTAPPVPPSHHRNHT